MSRRSADIVVTADPGAVDAADRVVVPGQGAMPDCMRELDAARAARRGRRGGGEQAASSASASACRCCSSASEEGDTPGLGIFPARSFAFRPKR